MSLKGKKRKSTLKKDFSKTTIFFLKEYDNLQHFVPNVTVRLSVADTGEADSGPKHSNVRWLSGSEVPAHRGRNL